MKLTPEMSISTRINVIEAALETVLNRGPEMSVGPGDELGALFVWVKGPGPDCPVGHSLYQIAREMEALLS